MSFRRYVVDRTAQRFWNWFTHLSVLDKYIVLLLSSIAMAIGIMCLSPVLYLGGFFYLLLVWMSIGLVVLLLLSCAILWILDDYKDWRQRNE